MSLPTDNRSAAPLEMLRQAELGGLHRVQQFLNGSAVEHFRVQRSLASRGVEGVDDSAKLSPWLAMGALSPRLIFRELRSSAQHSTPPSEDPEHRDNDAHSPASQHTWRAETLGLENKGGLDWILMHLTIRDFFLFTGLRAGSALFRASGIRGKEIMWPGTQDNARLWAAGRTGFPFVDASIRELINTGWTSNRSRQNVASFLTKDLQVDWRVGAEFFEMLLIDHDVAANYANWQYVGACHILYWHFLL